MNTNTHFCPILLFLHCKKNCAKNVLLNDLLLTLCLMSGHGLCVTTMQGFG